jgi:hypothetical protein
MDGGEKKGEVSVDHGEKWQWKEGVGNGWAIADFSHEDGNICRGGEGRQRAGTRIDSLSPLKHRPTSTKSPSLQ